MSFTRLDFLKLVTAAGAGSTFPLKDIVQYRRISKRNSDRPVIIASRNGLRGVEVAYNMITEDGSDPLDAAIEGVKIQELDPEDHSVGIGGLPNEEGVVQLDASCMHGPTKRAGSVAALEDIATPSMVAKAIMEYTDHIMLVGPDAKRFALNLGFKEEKLLTEQSRQMWLRWRSRLNPHDNWLEPIAWMYRYDQRPD